MSSVRDTECKMVLSKIRSFQFDDVLQNIKKGKVSSLFKSLKVCIASGKEHRNGKLPTSEGKFLIRVLRHICQCLAMKLENGLTNNDLLNIFQSTEFCIDHIEKYCNFQDIQQLSNGHYEKVLYHIISHFITAKQDEYAFTLITHFKDYVKKSLNMAIGSSLLTYTDNLFSVIWNYVSKHETFNAGEIFKKRLLALQLLSFNPKQLRLFNENYCFALKVYCKVENPDHQLVSHFLQNFCSNMHECEQKCSEVCVKRLVCRTVCRCLSTVYDKLLDQVRSDFLSMLNFLKTLAQEHRCTHSQLVNSISEIALFCITYASPSMEETVCISDTTLQAWEVIRKVDKETTEDINCVTSVFSVFLLLLDNILKALNNNRKTPNCNMVKSNLEVLICISGLYLQYFAVGPAQTFPDNRRFVISTMLQILYHILQQENDAKEASLLLPSVNFFADKLDTLLVTKESRNSGLEGFIIPLGKIAHQFMKWDSFAAAAQCLRIVVRGCEILITRYEATSLDDTDCWRYYKLLVICYQSMHLYEDALTAFIQGLLLKKDVECRDFELWLETKKVACQANYTEVVKRTVADILSEKRITVSQEKELFLLEKEFLAVKREYKEYDCTPELIAVITHILKFTPDRKIKALMLVELSQLEGFVFSDYFPDMANSTPVSLCQQASEILIQELDHNPNDVFCKIRHSYCYFWMYMHKINEVQATTSAKVEKESNNIGKRKKGSAEESNSDEDENDIKPAFFNVTTIFENALFEHLNKAVDLWKEIAFDIDEECISINDEIKRMNLLEVLLTTAEVFWTSGNENQTLVTWSLLHEFANHCQNNTYKLISLSSTAMLFINQGYLKLAGEFIELAENLIPSLPERKSWVKFSLSCCKSIYFLHQENFSEGLELLKSILESPTLKQNTTKHLILKYEAIFILVQYMLLNKSAFVKCLPSDIHDVPNDPITLINYCIAQCQQHLKVKSNEESRSLAWISWRHKIARLLFQNALVENQLLLDSGSLSKAKFLLNQALYMAQFLFHTYWASKLLIMGGYVDLMSGDFKSCEVKLTGLEYILKTKEANCKAVEAYNKDSDSDEDFNDSFLATRSDIDFRTKVRLDFVKKFEAMSLSPMTHDRQKTVKSEISNPFSCSCERCLLCSVKFTSLELGLLKCCYLMEKESKFDIIQHFMRLRDFFDQLTKTHSPVKDLPLFKCFQMTNNSLLKSISKSHAYFFIMVLLKQAVCNYRIKKVDDAMRNVHEAECLLKQYAKTPAVSCPNLFALVIVHKVELCLKFVTVQKIFNQPRTPKPSPLPVSTSSEIFSTPECRKIPPINVVKCSARPTFTSISNAPIKKGIIPADFKHGMDNCSPISEQPSYQSPSLFNLIHEGKTFKSPSNPHVKSTPQTRIKTKTCRRMPSTHSMRTLSRMGTESGQKSLKSRNYKFFTSKSQDIPSINAAKDIWSNVQNLDTVFALECETPAKKTSSRTCAKRNLPLKTQKTRRKVRSKESRSSSNGSSAEVKVKSEFKISEPAAETPFDISAELFTSPTFLSDAIEKTRNNPKSRTNKMAPMRSTKRQAQFIETPNVDLSERKVRNTRSRRKLLSVEMTLAENSSRSHVQTLKENVVEEVESFKSGAAPGALYKNIGKLSDGTRDEMLLCNFTPKEISDKFISVFERDLNVGELTKCLKSAIAAIEHRPPYPLYSELCKMLSLLMLPNVKTSTTDAFNVAYLLSESFGITLRNENVVCLNKKVEASMTHVNELSSELKTSSSASKFSCSNALNEINSQLSKCCSFSDKMQYMTSNLPSEWTVVQICLVKDSFLFGAQSKQNLCVCRYRHNATPYIKSIAVDKWNFKTYLAEFDAIRHENTVSTKAHDVEQFWKLRMNLNHRLKVFVGDICANWFGGWKGLFLGLPANQKRKDRIQEVVSKLPTLPHSNDQEMLEVLIDTAYSLSNEELSIVIESLWDTKNDDDMHDTIFTCLRTETTNFKDVNRHPVILIVDKDIQHLPWESMPINRNHPTVREPSLYFLNYQLMCHNQEMSLVSNGVDSSKTFYLLNPQGDMLRTQASFQDIFSKKMSWAGIVGRRPTLEEMQRAFTDYELVLYLGHGSGANFFNCSADIETLQCIASAVLMGCCSGSLTKSGPQMETTGDALRYYLGGCPCIVANLWEVTDKDIDLYTKSLLEDWLPNYNGKNTAKEKRLSIAAVSAKARNSCKLRYLNGAAPIIYGLPLFSKF